MENKEEKQEQEAQFLANIEEAKLDPEKAFEVYRNYVGKAETTQERIDRINRFRCGG